MPAQTKADHTQFKAPRPPILRIVRPFQIFAANKTSGGILLLACTIVALVWANSPFSASYASILHTNFTIGFDRFGLTRDLHFWVNDALMAVFFFVVGLEIKREFLVGELASARQASLPIVAALGGVVVPAAIYATLNAGGPGAAGWGIPMATDIAFALGVMALLGDRVPFGLKVFLTALAIVDDIAAVLVIAVFYTAQISWGALGAAAILIFLVFTLNRLGVRHPLVYALAGIALWVAVLQSGVHSTIAGVALAFMIPARTRLNSGEFLGECRGLLDHFERAMRSEKSVINDENQQSVVEALETACERVQPPLHRMEHALHPWVTFVVMPIFALTNAGVTLPANIGGRLSDPVLLGVVFGLVLGKPIGITTACWLAVRTQIASLPVGVTWKQIHGAGWLGGIGFTMSLFVAGLAFSHADLLTVAKLGILMASLCAGIAGSLLLLLCPRTLPAE